LAEATGFTAGSFQNEYGGRLNKWDEAERAQLMAELDAAYFLLYGINREDAAYILSTFKGIHDPTPLFPNSPHQSRAHPRLLRPIRRPNVIISLSPRERAGVRAP
jgi:hypothetical protein